MTEPICEVIITADDEDRLINFTRSLVEDRLAACGQHVAPIRSIYRWNGSIHDDREIRVALHTRASLVPAIVDRANRQLSYEVPCVLALSVETGNPDYLAWVIEQTSEPGADDQA
jgi:periplasmic divalent cation tolerance protein